MPATCPPLASGEGFLSSLLQHIDCQGRTLGQTGYEALAASTSPVGMILTSVLTIFVALFGIRMALGGTTTLRDSALAVVKVGIVLTLATSWPAFQVVIYDLILDGPAQIAQSIGLPGDATGGGDLVNRLQAADQAIIRLTNLGTGREEFASLPSPSGAGEAHQRFPIADNPAFGWARVVFLSGAVAAFAAVRLTAGLLLAVTPVFAALLLFDMARGLFIGWARALVFTFFASIAVATLLAVELTLLEPWLDQTISLRRAQAVTASAPVELLVLCLGFAVALVGAFGLIARMAFMAYTPLQSLFTLVGRHARAAVSAPAGPVPMNAPDRADADRPPSRALVVADAVAAAQRREGSRASSSRARQIARSPAPAPAHPAPDAASDLIIPTFGLAARRARPRTSLGARLRDRRS